MLSYLKIPIALAGESVGSAEDKDVTARVQPAMISAYHPGFYWGTFIYLQNGQVLCSRMECEELERMIQAYWEKVSTPPAYNGKKNPLLISK